MTRLSLAALAALALGLLVACRGATDEGLDDSVNLGGVLDDTSSLGGVVDDNDEEDTATESGETRCDDQVDNDEDGDVDCDDPDCADDEACID